MENNTFENYSAPSENNFQNKSAKLGGIVAKIKALPKQMLIKIGAGIVALILVITLLGSLGNSARSTIKATQKLYNTKSYTKVLKQGPKMLNGFGEAKAKKALKIFKKSDVYKDNLDDAKESFEDMIDAQKDKYGKNYKIKLKINSKDKLEKEELKEYKDEVRTIANAYLDRLNNVDIDELADKLGLSRAQTKKLVKLAKDFFKDAKKAKVSSGYEVDVTEKITGKELDEPMESDYSIYVYKVNGKWTRSFSHVLSQAGVFDFLDYL